MKKKILAVFLSAVMTLAVIPLTASAKTHPEGQTVSTVLFYTLDADGQRVLVSRVTVPQMEADMKAGILDDTLHNYSLLDRFVTPVHQESEGMTVSEFVEYASSKSTDSDLRAENLHFRDEDQIAFWEIDQTGYDDMDTYTYNDLYGVERYNYPYLYKYWNYRTQDYADPDGKMTREETIDHIFRNAENESVMLSVRAFSQRYIVTDTKYETGDYNMENYWNDCGYLDNERTLRLMIPMTEADLRDKVSTANNSRYWVSQILLKESGSTAVRSKGLVAAPTASMTEDDDYYYIRFDCETEGASIYYNSNLISPGYMPTARYKGSAVRVSKSQFPEGTVTMTAHAVKDGWADAGVVTLQLKAEGEQKAMSFHDVRSGAWYRDAVEYVSRVGLMKGTGAGEFSPGTPMERYMLTEVLYRLAGSPDTSDHKYFEDTSLDSVTWCYENGVFNGMSETSFEPKGRITREQIAAMLCRYAKVCRMDMDRKGDLSQFRDRDDISSWALSSLEWANGAGLINGMGDGTLDPKGTATRAQLAQILYNFSKLK